MQLPEAPGIITLVAALRNDLARLGWLKAAICRSTCATVKAVSIILCALTRPNLSALRRT
jgi:hypothetical protein